MVEGSVDEGGGSVEDAGESDSGPEDPPEAGSLLIQEELEVCFPSSAISLSLLQMFSLLPGSLNKTGPITSNYMCCCYCCS